MNDNEDAGVVWVNSELLPDGSYRCAIAFTDDRSVVLDEPAAVTYTLAVLDAVQSAEYDAAVFAQLRAIGLDEKTTAAFLVADLRPARRPLRDTGQPITFRPGVSSRTHRAFLHVAIDGETVGQWDLQDARKHATHVLEALLAADYDTAYHRALTSTLSLDDPRARGAVQDIARHRG